MANCFFVYFPMWIEQMFTSFRKVTTIEHDYSQTYIHYCTHNMLQCMGRTLLYLLLGKHAYQFVGAINYSHGHEN